jgi:hypothetical protein
MNPKILKYLLIIMLCMVFTVSAASAVDDLFFSQAKQALIKQYAQQASGGGKPLPGLGPGGQTIYVGTLPFIIHAGDTLDLHIYGDVLKGQKFAFQIDNWKFAAAQGNFTLNVTGVHFPVNASQENVTVNAQPVSWLKIESEESGIIKSLESSSPDLNGRITLTATGINENKSQIHDYMATEGTPTVPMVTVNYKLEGIVAEDVMNPQIPFHIEQAKKGSFTLVVSIDSREKLRETIFVL